MNNIKKYAKILHAEIDSSEKILIVSHVNPDGDAIGTGLGLLNALKNYGKKCHFIIPNDPPQFLTWMKSSKEMIIYSKKSQLADTVIKSADLIIFVDFNDLKRLGDAASSIQKSDAKKILIDHHPDPEDFADFVISESKIGSASELVYILIKAMGLKEIIDQDVAACFYAGIMTDTGNFSFACSYPEVWQNVGELIDLNIDRNRIYSEVYDNYSENRMRLMGYCLNEKLELLKEYNTAIISLTDREMKDFNFQTGDTEGFVNLPFSVKGVKLSVLFIEKKDHVKLSLRSRGTFSVNDFARKHFSGGGHVNAAGGEAAKPIEKAIQKFKDHLSDYMEELQ